MPWKSLKDVPPSLRKLKGVPLTLAQANAIARCADTLIAEEGMKKSSAWAICISSFQKSHVIKDGRWVKKEKAK